MQCLVVVVVVRDALRYLGRGGGGACGCIPFLVLAIGSERHSLCAGPRVAHGIQGELLHWGRVVCRVLPVK